MQDDDNKPINNLEKIDHIAITVNDIKESVNWYLKNFKCQVGYQDETWAMLKFDNINLAFVQKKQHPNHIGLKKVNARNYGELKTHRDGTKSVYISDPSGNSIEIMEDC